MVPKKKIYTLNINRKYNWKVTAMTYPLLQYWATKIGATFHEIVEPYFSLPENGGWPERYEKFQISILAQQDPADWHIYIDCDALVHPDMIDPTVYMDKATVAHNGNDVATNRWRTDEYFLRDGRQISSCNWLAIASDWCLDLWRPSEIPLEECVKNIFPVLGEVHGGTVPAMLIDDYVMSRNISRFGLKFTTVTEICKQRLNNPNGNFMMWHSYNCPVEEKVYNMKNVILGWGIGTREELAAVLKEDPATLTSPPGMPQILQNPQLVGGAPCAQ